MEDILYQKKMKWKTLIINIDTSKY